MLITNVENKDGEVIISLRANGDLKDTRTIIIAPAEYVSWSSSSGSDVMRVTLRNKAQSLRAKKKAEPIKPKTMNLSGVKK